jgi:hypothetical protein
LRELRLGLIENRLKRTRVDLEQDLAFADGRTFFVFLRDEIAGYLWLDLRVFVPVQRRYPLLIYGNVLLRDGDDVHRDGRLLRSGLVVLASDERHGNGQGY